MVLRNDGYKIEESKAAISRLAEEKATDTHPAKDARIAAVENGYRASLEVANVEEAAARPVSGKSSILAKIRLEDGEYYLTSHRDILRRTTEGNVVLMGHRTEIGSEGLYEYSIGNTVYQDDSRGQLLSSDQKDGSPRKLGQINYYRDPKLVTKNTVKGTLVNFKEADFITIRLTKGGKIKLPVEKDSQLDEHLSSNEVVRAHINEAGKVILLENVVNSCGTQVGWCPMVSPAAIGLPCACYTLYGAIPGVTGKNPNENRK
jgi:hypothetical protein